MRKTLKGRFLIPVLIVTFIGVLIETVVYYHTAKNIINNNVKELANNKVDKLVNVLDSNLDTWKNTIEMFSQYYSVKTLERTNFLKKINSEKHLIKDFESIAIVDKEGRIEDNCGYEGNISIEKYFKKGIERGTIVSEPIKSRVNDKPIIVISTPIRDKNEEVVGLVLGKINMKHITEMINKEKIGQNGYAFMLDKTGRLMAYPEVEQILNMWHVRSEDKDIGNVCRDMISGKEGIGKYNFQGESKLVVYKHVNNAPWSVAMTASYHETFRDLFSLKVYTTIVAIITLVTIMFILYKLIKSVTTPIEEMKKCMEIGASGNLDIKCQIKSKDELGSLADSLNTLINENRRLIYETKESERKKMDFFANMSHEIKTPVNIISSTLQLLKINGVPIDSWKLNDIEKKKYKYYLDVMEQNNLRIIRYIDNLIDLSELDAGILNLRLFRVDIVKLVEDINIETNRYIENNNSDKKIIFDTNVEEKYMVVDKEKIERVVLNLLSNAYKFIGNSNFIHVEVYDKIETVEIIIKDEGKGIPKDKQKIIFNRFSQVENLLNREHEGSGIGLFLVKSFIDLHNGKIEVISKEGQGSKFKVTLPTNLQENMKENKIIEKSNMKKIEIEFSDIY